MQKTRRNRRRTERFLQLELTSFVVSICVMELGVPVEATPRWQIAASHQPPFPNYYRNDGTSMSAFYKPRE